MKPILLQSPFTFFVVLLVSVLTHFSNEIYAQESVEVRLDSMIATFPELDETIRGKAIITFTQEYLHTDIEEALEVINRLQQYGEEVSDTIVLINSFALKAEYHWRKGDYQSGVLAGMDAIEFAQQNERFELELARGHQTVGTIHLYLYNSDEAIAHYRAAAEIYKSNDMAAALAGVLNNTGVVYMDAAEEQNNEELIDSALYYFEEALQFKGRMKTHTILNALGNMGSIYVERENWTEAKRAYDEWERFEKDNPNKTARAMHYGAIGQMHLKTGSIQLAENYLTEGLDLAKDLGSKFEIQEYYYHLSQFYESKENFKEAYGYAKMWTSLKDSLFDVEKVNKINELEANYDSVEKEKQIQKANNELERRRIYQVFLTIIILLVVALSVFVYFYQKQKHQLLQQRLLTEVSQLRGQIKELVNKYEGHLDMDLETLNGKLVNSLSQREFDVMKLTMTGKTNQEIADEIFVSLSTVKFHMGNIYNKLGVSNRKQAVEYLTNAK